MNDILSFISLFLLSMYLTFWMNYSRLIDDFFVRFISVGKLSNYIISLLLSWEP